MNRIRELRLAQGMKQTELAKRLACRDATISRYENELLGLDAPTVLKLCEIFGCTADYLLGRSASPLPAVTEEDAALLQAIHAAPPHILAAIKTLLQPYQKESESAQAI